MTTDDLVLNADTPIDLHLEVLAPVELTLVPGETVELTLAPPPELVLTLDAPAPIVLELAPVGLPGPVGPTGPAADPVHVHHQVVPAAEWTIRHGHDTPREPVIFTDDDPTRPAWTDWTPTGDGTMVLTFPSPCTGYAYI